MEERKIIGYCSYCKEPIYEGEPLVKVGDDLYHYSEDMTKSCFFPVEEIEIGGDDEYYTFS